jgi:formamidopyrimidine-DNA glycosylase
MPEIPETSSRAREMNQALAGKTIVSIQILQPKSLNVTEEHFKDALTGASIRSVTNHGKWIFWDTTQGWMLLNLGMGGETLLVRKDQLPEKHRVVFEFEDGLCLSINFWWFGYVHYVPEGELDSHKMTRDLGPNAIDLSVEELKSKIRGKRSRLKSFLLDQTQIAGIGNAYVHDILFLARLHPLRTLDSLTGEDIQRLAQAIQDGLQPSLAKGGAFYELDIYGKPGGFTREDIIIGYQEGKPCPDCGATIEKIKTGGTSSFICSKCQPL